MILAALQPSYLPWLGFFEQIARADVFLLCDELNYEKYSWRNRNRVKTAAGWTWLTVPIVQEQVWRRPICQAEIFYGRGWQRKHLRTLEQNYGASPYFASFEKELSQVLRFRWKFLSELCVELIELFCGELGVRTPLLIQSRLDLEKAFVSDGGGDSTDRIIFFCREFGADVFYNGEAGRNYIKLDRVAQAGIELVFQDYQHPVYPQLWGEFVPYLSIVDLLSNCGPRSLTTIMGKDAGPFDL